MPLGNRRLFALWMLAVLMLAHRATGRLAQDSPKTTTPATTLRSQLLISFLNDSSVAFPDKESLQLSIEKKPVTIEAIESLENRPLYFSVLVDVSGSSKSFAAQQKAAATALFHELASQNNRGYLILFTSEIATNDRPLSESAVEKVMARYTPDVRTGSTALFDAIVHAASGQLSHAKIPEACRRAIFIVSDGGDNTSHSSLEDAAQAAQRENIPIFSIGFSKDPNKVSARETKREVQTLRALSTATGGAASFLDESTERTRTAKNLTKRQFLVTFQSPPLKPGRSYPVKLEFRDRSVLTLLPESYLAK